MLVLRGRERVNACNVYTKVQVNIDSLMPPVVSGLHGTVLAAISKAVRLSNTSHRYADVVVSIFNILIQQSRLAPLPPLKAYGERSGIAPLIHNLASRWM